MRDVLYVLITLAFFAVCTGLVRACDALLGPDEDDLLEVGTVEDALTGRSVVQEPELVR